MRQVTGTIIREPYQIYHPFRMLISGSSGAGKTTFCESLLQSNITHKFNQIYYIYPEEFDKPPGIIKIHVKVM